MSVELIGLLGIVLMFILMFLRVPISISMFIPALIGILYLKGWNVLSAAIETIVWNQSFSYTMVTIPMFILMGELLFIAGISSELFQTFRLWFGKFRGGLGIATIVSSAFFAASSGSSLATTATMGVVSSKEMLQSNYDKSFASGTILAGGTLGVLIPPSTLMIIYGMMTEQSIGKLLIAGIIPGIILALLYIITAIVSTLFQPKLAPKINETVSWKERFLSLKSTIWILIIFLIVIGGMYLGYFNPIEAGGIGAFMTFIIAIIRRKLTVSSFIEALSRTLNTTAFLFAIMIMAFILNYFFVITKVPMVLAEFVTGLALADWALFALIIFIYLILGAVMDNLAMMVITMPIVLPIIESMNLDLIWFGVIMVLIMEMAVLSPPVGMNCFILNGVAPELKLTNIYKGAILFLIPILIMIAILYIFPEIALFLPDKMY